MAVTTSKTNKPILPRGADVRPIDSYNRASLYSGKALDFDGVNDSVDLNSSIDFTGDFSFCFYFSTAIIGVRGIISNGTNVDSIGTDSTSNKSFRFRLNSVNVAFAINSVYDDGLNFWSFVRSGSTLYVYKNGIQVGSQSVATNTFTLGMVGAQGVGVNYFNGELTNLKAFNTTLTAAQVADLYNNPEKVVPTGVDNTALKLWLPMMEGAGTTAYDGSGNGNHGTISGATYVNGVGAPVAQSAVMDWNKGTNILEYSIWNNSYWTASGGVVTDGVEAPDGTNTAFKFERDDASSGAIYNVAPTGLSGTNYRYVYAKLPSGSASASAQLLNHNTNTNNTFTITDQWQRFEVDSSPLIPTNFYIVDFRDGVGVDEIHLWAPQAAAGTDESVFVPTIGTAQGSEVLLPQGLTSGRDITGVNLFENVRKQGALNLDGNSWAEVHDNASLDITSAITLEAWFYDTDEGAFEGVIGKWKDSTQRTYAIIKNNGSNNFLIRISTDGSAQAGPTITNTDYGWIHLVLTYDGSSVKGYKNGVYQSQAALTGSIATNDLPVEIGRYGQSTGSQYNNQIAQPRIYNRALTASEVLNNFNATKDLYI